MNAFPARFVFPHCSFAFLLMGMTAPVISSATDLRIETKIEENYILEKRVEKSTNILQATETEVRLDVGNQSSFLVDLKTGRLKVLNHKAKIVEEERPGTVIAKIGALIRGETPVRIKDWKATGKTEKIADHECKIYREDVELMQTDFWVATTGFEEYGKLSPEVKRAMQVLGNEVIFQASPPCMILKEEGGLKNALMTTKTSTFSFADIASGTLLKVPADYQPGEVF